MKIPRLLALAAAFPVWGAVHADPAGNAWTLTSGANELRVDRAGDVRYVGPAGGAAKFAPCAAGADWQFERAQIQNGTPDSLTLLLQREGLAAEVRYAAWADTGTFTRQVTLRNRSANAVQTGDIPSFCAGFPPGDYELTYLWGGWGQERQSATEPLGPGRRSFVSDRGRSSSLYAPWFALRNRTAGSVYAAELAWSGNWEMNFERLPATGSRPISAEPQRAWMGVRWDNGVPATLAPGQAVRLPTAEFTAATGDLDDAANQLHRYQRRFVFARTSANSPLVVQFNSWYPFPGQPHVAEMKKTAEVAAELGAEAFVLDSGWYNRESWEKEVGDYRVNPEKFPNGLEELAEYVRKLGLKFGIWVEIESAGIESQTYKEHPDWCLAGPDGKPVLHANRCNLNFANPAVREWAHGVVDRLARDYRLGWIKIDYNQDVGNAFAGPGTALYDHVVSYYQWLDEVRRKHPDLIVENCSSGGLRFDTGIMAHAHTTWISDEVKAKPSLQLAYGCTLQFSPEVCNHWMVGDSDDGKVNLAAPAGWWDFLFRVPMNGQFGFSSRVTDWSPELKKRAAENIALYKRIRSVIADADVYHLTPPPAHEDPTGWMAIQYVTPDRKRSVVMAYRLGDSPSTAEFRLRGLDPAIPYRTRSTDTLQKSAPPNLMLRADSPWRAVVVEFEATR